jgi:hypothetical protein
VSEYKDVHWKFFYLAKIKMLKKLISSLFKGFFPIFIDTGESVTERATTEDTAKLVSNPGKYTFTYLL